VILQQADHICYYWPCSNKCVWPAKRALPISPAHPRRNLVWIWRDERAGFWGFLGILGDFGGGFWDLSKDPEAFRSSIFEWNKMLFLIKSNDFYVLSSLFSLSLSVPSRSSRTSCRSPPLISQSFPSIYLNRLDGMRFPGKLHLNGGHILPHTAALQTLPRALPPTWIQLYRVDISACIQVNSICI
jgi:hypothetical protein